MNMIFNAPSVVATGTKEKETNSASKAALAKLMAAWEAKQKSAKKMGSFGLLAVTLAACNSDDDDDAAPAASAVDTTPFSQAQLDAAVAAIDITSDNNSAINAAVQNATSFTTLDGLVAAYNLLDVAATTDPVLLTSTDFITGTAGDDTYVALQTGAAATETWGVADSIDGAGGSDTLNLTNTENAAINAGTLTSVENMVYRGTGGVNADLDLANFLTVTNVTMDRPVAGIDLTSVDTGDTLSLKDLLATSDMTVTYTTAGTAAALATAGDSATVTISGASAGADVQFAGDVETMTVNTSAATSLADLVFDGGTTTITMNSAATTAVTATFTAAATTSMTITGAGKTTITPDLPATVATITASDSAGGVDIDTGATAEATNAVATFDQTDFTFTGGAAADTLDLSSTPAAREVSVTMGAGDDIVIMDEEVAGDTAAAATAGDSIDGGDGSDTLSYSATTALDATHETQNVNFETIRVTGTANITMTNLDNFAAKNFSSTVSDAADDNTAVTASFDDLLTGSTVTADAAAGATTVVAGTGDADGVVLNMNLTTDDATALTAADSITINVADGYGGINDDDGANGDFELVTINSTGGTVAAPITHDLIDFADADTLTINATGLGALTIGSIVAQTTTDVVATASTQAITATLTTAIDSYAGGTGVDTITTASGAIANGNTYTDAGGATDSLSGEMSNGQNAGILAVSGYETVSLTPNGGGDTVIVDVRNVTGMTTLDLNTAHANDDFTVNNVKTGTTIEISGAAATNTAAVRTTVGDSATSQSFSNTVASTITSLVLDAGTTTLNFASGDSDGTAAETFTTLSGITGAALATINVTGDDDLILPTLATTTVTMDGTGSTGDITVTASTTATALKGGTGADALTGGSAADTITGGAGIDTIIGAAGADRIVFEATGSGTGSNGLDVITFVTGAAADILDFSAFLTAGTVFQNGAAGNAITPVAHTATADVDITNKVVLLHNGAAAGHNTAVEIAGEIDGAANALSITAGGKGVIIEGDNAGGTIATAYYVHDVNGDGDVGDANEVMPIMTGVGNLDLDTTLTSNIDVVA